MAQTAEPEQTSLVLRNDPTTNPAWTFNQLEALRPLLDEKDKKVVLKTLRDQGYTFGQGFDSQSLAAIQEKVAELIEGIEFRVQLPPMVAGFNKKLRATSGLSFTDPSVEKPIQLESIATLFTQIKGAYDLMVKTNFTPINKDRKLQELRAQGIEIDPSFDELRFTELKNALSLLFKARILEGLRAQEIEIDSSFDELDVLETLNTVQALLRRMYAGSSPRVFPSLGNSPELPGLRGEATMAQAARLIRLGNTEARLRKLRKILTLNDKVAVLGALKEQKVELDADFESQDLVAIQRAVEALIHEIERRSQVPGITADFNARLTTALFPVEAWSREKDVAPDHPSLSKLKEDFDRNKGLFVLREKKVTPKPGERPADVLARKQPDKSNLLWEDVVERLNRPHWKNHEKTGLELALALKDGGELMGVDQAGRLLIRDRGPEPTLLGEDYWKTYEKVYGPEGKPTGYELFPKGDDQFEKPPVISLYEQVRSHFIQGVETNETSTWLDNGRATKEASVQTLDARKVVVPVGVVYLDAPIPRSDRDQDQETETVRVPYKSGNSATYTITSVTSNRPELKLPTRGAVRLLKV